MNLLTVEDLSVSIGGKQVCRSLSFQLERTQCWGVLGANGVGKTTLLHTLAGLRAPEAGSIKVADRALAAWPRRQLARTIGLLPQDSLDPFPANVLETALIGRHPHLRAWQWESERDHAAARAAIKQVGLDGLEHRQVATLSGGERRRLALATLFTQQPELYLLDEPSNHLDLRHQIELISLLMQYAQQGGVMMTLHDINLAARFCDHLLMLFGDGEALAGPANIMLQEENLSRLYDHPIRRISNGLGVAFVRA